MEIKKSKEDYADEDDISGMDPPLECRVFIEMENRKLISARHSQTAMNVMKTSGCVSRMASITNSLQSKFLKS